MHTIKITSAHRGQTVATNGTLTTAYGAWISLMDELRRKPCSVKMYQHRGAFLRSSISACQPRCGGACYRVEPFVAD
jgi:hypothetical protein